MGDTSKFSDDEKWSQIAGYEGMYDVSNFGRVRSHDRYSSRKDGRLNFYKGKICKQFLTTHGYLRVVLTKFDGGRHIHVHKLVATTFIPNKTCTAKNQVNHINGVKTDNHVSNLEWVTCKENIHHAIQRGIFKKKRKKPNENE